MKLLNKIYQYFYIIIEYIIDIDYTYEIDLEQGLKYD